MSLGPVLLSLVGTFVSLLLLARPAQSMVVSTGPVVCLSSAAAKATEDMKVVLCGFPVPQGGADVSSVPFGCHRQSAELLRLLEQELGLQGLGADNVCYLSYRESDAGLLLNLDPVADLYKSSAKLVQVRLLRSVSELVGITPTLQITGRSLATVNPEIFSAIGPAQKERLKYLCFSGTGLSSIDLSLLEPLKLAELLLISNTQLDRITNYKDITLPTITDLVIWNANPGLLNCSNALPGSLTNVYLLQDGFNTCVLCNLPRSIQKIIVKSTITSLSHFPGTPGTDSMLPFPLSKTYHYLENVPGVEATKEFDITGPASGCQPVCQCKPWPKPETTSALKPTAAAPRAPEQGRNSQPPAQPPIEEKNNPIPNPVPKESKTEKTDDTTGVNGLVASSICFLAAVAVATVREYV